MDANSAGLGVAAGTDCVWIHQTRIDPPDALKRLYFAFMPLNRREHAFRPLNQEDTLGEVIRAAVRGGSLHVFFRDGTHIRYEPEVRRLAGPQAAFWELKLPDSYVPPALAGDASGGVLYAVVLGRIAEALEAAESQAATGSARKGPTSVPASSRHGLQIGPAPDPSGPQSRPATRPVLSKYALVRFERGLWRRDREIPAFFDDQSACLLAADGDRCDLYFVREGRPDTVWFAMAEGENWSAADALLDVRWHHLLACTKESTRSGALTRGEDGALNVLAREAEGWRVQRRLEIPADGDDPAERRELSAGLTNQIITAAWIDRSGSVRAAAWDAAGKTRAAPHAVSALRPPPDSEGLQTFREIAPFVVLGLALIYVFSRRRESVIFPAVLKSGQKLARHSRRLGAFFLDAVIVAPITLPVMYGWTRHLDAEAEVLEAVQVAMGEHFAELFWRWLIALAGFVLYCIVFEAARGGTPGKLLLGCRVVTEKGERCGLRAIVLRNVLRVVEFFPGFDFAPLLLLVFLTRNRQRLGDLVARSVVVEIGNVGGPIPFDAGKDPSPPAE